MSAQEISLAAVGDVMMGRGLAPVVSRRGPEHLLRHAAELFGGADLVFGNLEAPLLDGGRRNLSLKPADEPFFKVEPRCGRALAAAGFNVLSLANSHINDYGGEGIRRTREILTQYGIASTGAGRGHDDARQPVLVERNGLRVALLAYTDHFVRPRDEWGVAPLREKIMHADIRRQNGEGYRVIVSIHTGIDFCDYPYPFTIRLARRLIEAGADLVLGHHPHVLQGWERHKGGVILYSLGNFVFDGADPDLAAADYARSPYVERFGLRYEPSDTRPSDTVVFRCRLTEEGVRGEQFVPARINRDGQPVRLPGPQGERLLMHLHQISSHFDDPEFLEWSRLERLFLDRSVGGMLRNPLALLRQLHRVRPGHLGQLGRWLVSRIRREA